MLRARAGQSADAQRPSASGTKRRNGGQRVRAAASGTDEGRPQAAMKQAAASGLVSQSAVAGRPA